MAKKTPSKLSVETKEYRIIDPANVKQSIEVAVKEKPKVEDLETIEKVGDMKPKRKYKKRAIKKGVSKKRISKSRAKKPSKTPSKFKEVKLKVITIFAERINGKMTLRRGFIIPKDCNVLIVEDVITSGKSALECTDLVKIYDANLIGYSCIIDRSDNKALIKDKIISQVKFKIDTFKKNELPADLKKIPTSEPGSRNLTK